MIVTQAKTNANNRNNEQRLERHGKQENTSFKSDLPKLREQSEVCPRPSLHRDAKALLDPQDEIETPAATPPELETEEVDTADKFDGAWSLSEKNREAMEDEEQKQVTGSQFDFSSSIENQTTKNSDPLGKHIVLYI